jgi:hypothetical protein
LDAIKTLEATPISTPAGVGWPPRGFYLLWHVVVGMMLGFVGATVSLLSNVIGAPLFGKPPLELIRVYLTFPMGAAALDPNVADAKVLAVGCTLYLVTGAVHGVFFHLVMSVYFAKVGAGRRLVIATLLGLLLWVVSFYGVLSWLQPMLLGGNWIIAHIPWWVAALTHLAFAWTMLALESWGTFEPYLQPASATDESR